LNELASANSTLSLKPYRDSLTALLGKPSPGYGPPTTPLDTDTTSLRHLSSKLLRVLYALQSADVAPTHDQESALAKYEQALVSTEKQWNAWLTTDLPKLNQQLKQEGVKEISQAAAGTPEVDEGDNNDNDR
jgi:hypothetical protein